MLLNAIMLVQDTQLVCFCLIFAFFAFQHWEERSRRWLWYGFLANGVGAVLDFSPAALPAWLGTGVNCLMIPLSYVLLNIAVLRFLDRAGYAQWFAWGILAAVTAPTLWLSTHRQATGAFALQDLSIALECLLAAVLLFFAVEAATRLPRRLLGGFLLLFALIELARVAVVAATGADPDTIFHSLELVSAIGYVVNTSLLPLGFVWMINSRLEADLRLQAVMDPLTQVLNRRGLRTELDRELARKRRSGLPLTVVVADLDHFKQWNDRYGHGSGDWVLVNVAALLRKHLRATDVLARVGGEEFVLLLPGTAAEEARVLLNRLCTSVAGITVKATDGSPNSQPGRVTMSFGASVSSPEDSAGTLLHQADVALYQAKHDGRNCVRIFDPKSPGGKGYPGEEARAHRWHGLTVARTTEPRPSAVPSTTPGQKVCG